MQRGGTSLHSFDPRPYEVQQPSPGTSLGGGSEDFQNWGPNHPLPGQICAYLGNAKDDQPGSWLATKDCSEERDFVCSFRTEAFFQNRDDCDAKTWATPPPLGQHDRKPKPSHVCGGESCTVVVDASEKAANVSSCLEFCASHHRSCVDSWASDAGVLGYANSFSVICTVWE